MFLYRFLLLLFFLFVVSICFSQIQSNFEKDSLFAKKILDRGGALSGKEDTRCFLVLDSVIEFCKNKKQSFFKFALIEAKRYKGSFYSSTGKYDTAKYVLNQAMQEAVANNIDKLVARINITLAIVADHQADYETSINKNMSSLKYYENIKDTQGIFLVSGNLGNTYIRLRQYNKAVEAISKAIELGTIIHKKIQVANCMNNLARAYKALGNKKKELELKLAAFTIYKEENNKHGLATVSGNLGNYYEKENELDLAFKYYNISLANSWAIGETGNIAIMYNNMSDLFIKTKEYGKAMQCIDSAAYFSKKSGNKLSYRDAKQNKADLLFIEGKYAEAYTIYKEYASLNDSIFNDQMQHKIADMEVKYETDKQQNKIAFLTKDNTIQGLQIKNQTLALDANEYMIASQQLMLDNDSLELLNKNESILRHQQEFALQEQKVQRLNQQSIIKQLEIDNNKLEVKKKNLVLMILIASSLLLTLLGYLYYRRFKNKKEQQLKIAIAQQQHLATKALFEGEQKERIRIARDLHDSIGQMLSVVKMQVSTLHLNATGDNKILTNSSLNIVDKTIAEVRSISHNLIPEELNFGFVAAIEELCSSINTAGKATVDCNVDEAIRKITLSKQTELSVYRIIQEILGNMAKHAEATQIDVNIFSKGNIILLQLKDNGKGFDTSLINQSKGLGWKNILARVNLLNGNMNLQSEKITGTQIEITIPK